MKKLLFLLIFFLCFFLESVFTTLPLLFIAFLITSVIEKDYTIIFMALIFGLMLDMMTFRTIGATSLFLLIALFIVNLYERKFETSSIYFVSAFGFLGTLAYSVIFETFSIFEVIFSSLITMTFFFFLERIFKKNLKGRYLKREISHSSFY